MMWYEVDMVSETLDSLCNAIANTNKDVRIDLRFAFNYQTYIETPDIQDVKSLFDPVRKHRVFDLPNNKELIEIKTDDPFYNLGDWRRDNYGDDYDYYVWGESDCLVPKCYFNNLNSIEYPTPHVVSYANRKMWDSTWLPVEHEMVKHVPYDGDMELIGILGQHPYMSEEQMNVFNSLFPTVLVEISNPYKKIDGNMMAIGRGIPTPILPYDLHFIHDDLALEILLKKRNVPQLHFPYQLKAHNRMHPRKRKYTKTKREEEMYKYRQEECMNAIRKLANEP